jgi:hypothetical protein
MILYLRTWTLPGRDYYEVPKTERKPCVVQAALVIVPTDGPGVTCHATPRTRKELCRDISEPELFSRPHRAEMACARRGDESASWADKRPIRVGGTAARNRTAQQRAPRLGGIRAGKMEERVDGGQRKDSAGRGTRGEARRDSRILSLGGPLRVPGLRRGGLREREKERERERKRKRKRKKERRRGKGEEAKEKRVRGRGKGEEAKGNREEGEACRKREEGRMKTVFSVKRDTQGRTTATLMTGSRPCGRPPRPLSSTCGRPLPLAPGHGTLCSARPRWRSS